MQLSARRVAALAALVVVLASLAPASIAMASSSTITSADCAQGTIKDQSTGRPISQARCKALIGRNVQLAATGFDLLPVFAVAVLCLAGAAALGMRRRSEERPA